MSTKDFLKGLKVTIIPYCKGRKADAVGEIAEVVTSGEGTGILIKSEQVQMRFDIVGDERGDICRLLDGRPVLMRERDSGEYDYVIKTASLL